MNKKIINIILIVIWIGVIFNFSSQQAEVSDSLSKYVTKELSLDMTKHKLVRKMAHVTEYAVLGFLISIAIKKVNLTMFISLILASLDESFQMFVPGRGPGIKDVVIDEFGVMLGVIMGYYVVKLLKIRIKDGLEIKL